MKNRPMSKHFKREKFSKYTEEEMNVIAEELTAIEASEGVVRTTRVLELARKPSHRLHGIVFKLNDRQAAERWRLIEIRRMCKSVRVVWEDDSGKEKLNIPMMVSVRVESERTNEEGIKEKFIERAYRSTERALADPVQRDDLLSEAKRQAEHFAIRYSMLKEASKVVAAIREFLQ